MQNLFKQRIKNGSPIRPPEETSADFSKALIFFGTRVPEKSGGRCRYCDPIRFDPIGLQKLARFSQSNPIFSFLYPCVSFFGNWNTPPLAGGGGGLARLSFFGREPRGPGG